jgi:RND family efflux transporter MFP subunit
MKKLLLLFTVLACQAPQKSKEEDKAIQSVKVSTVMEQDFHETVQSSGTLASRAEVKLAFKTGGVIKKSYVEEGQAVKAGQLLAELDLSEVEAQVNQAQIGYDKAHRDFERVQKLYAEEAATKTLLNDAKSGLDLADQTLHAAKFNQKLSKIHAPAPGRILVQLAEQGELIAPFSPMFILGTGEQAYTVKVGLTDRDVVKISLGDAAEVQLDAYPGEVLLGKVRQVAQIINPSTGTYPVEIELLPVNKRLISGFIASVEIKTKRATRALVVPIEALVNARAEIADVYIHAEGKAIKRTISIGKIQGEYVTVLSGLSPGDVVITLGSGFVSNGDPVLVP